MLEGKWGGSTVEAQAVNTTAQQQGNYKRFYTLISCRRAWLLQLLFYFSAYSSAQSFFFRSLLIRIAQKFGPHIVQYSPSFTLLSL